MPRSIFLFNVAESKADMMSMDSAMKAPHGVDQQEATAAPATLLKVCLILTALRDRPRRSKTSSHPALPPFCGDVLPPDADVRSVAQGLGLDERLARILSTLPREDMHRRRHYYERDREDGQRFRFRYTSRSLSVIG